MLDRDSLLVIDPIADSQDVEEALTDGDLKEPFEEYSVKVSTLKDVKKPIDAVVASPEVVSQNNPKNLKVLEGLVEVESDEVHAEFEEVLDL